MYKALQLTIIQKKIFTDEKDNCKQRNYQPKFLYKITIINNNIRITRRVWSLWGCVKLVALRRENGGLEVQRSGGMKLAAWRPIGVKCPAAWRTKNLINWKFDTLPWHYPILETKWVTIYNHLIIFTRGSLNMELYKLNYTDNILKNKL
jgi:hypothetical protein